MLAALIRFEEAKSLFRKTIPVARRVLGDSDETTLTMRVNYAATLYSDGVASELCEAATTLEDVKLSLIHI